MEPELINGHSFVGLQIQWRSIRKLILQVNWVLHRLRKHAHFWMVLQPGTRKQKVIVYLHHHPFLFPDEGVLKKIGGECGHRLEDGSHFMKEIKNQRVDILFYSAMNTAI